MPSKDLTQVTPWLPPPSPRAKRWHDERKRYWCSAAVGLLWRTASIIDTIIEGHLDVEKGERFEWAVWCKFIVGWSFSLGRRRNNTFIVKMNLRRSQRFCRVYGDGCRAVCRHEKVTPGANTHTQFTVFKIYTFCFLATTTNTPNNSSRSRPISGRIIEKKLIVTNYFISLTKGSCGKNRHFFRFRWFHSGRQFRTLVLPKQENFMLSVSDSLWIQERGKNTSQIEAWANTSATVSRRQRGSIASVSCTKRI